MQALLREVPKAALQRSALKTRKKNFNTVHLHLYIVYEIVYVLQLSMQVSVHENILLGRRRRLLYKIDKHYIRLNQRIERTVVNEIVREGRNVVCIHREAL